jgi:hypothetical protein
VIVCEALMTHIVIDVTMITRRQEKDIAPLLPLGRLFELRVLSATETAVSQFVIALCVRVRYVRCVIACAQVYLFCTDIDINDARAEATAKRSVCVCVVDDAGASLCES